MSEELGDILGGVEPSEPVETQAEPIETPVEEVAQEPEVEAAPEPAPEADPEPAKTVPLSAMMEERKKRQELEAKMAELSAPKPESLPDVFEDPEKFGQSVEERIAQIKANSEADVSERFARMKHGDDVVNSAFEAVQAAGLVDQFRGKPDAWNDVVTWHQSQQALAEIGDPSTYKDRIREELRAEIQAELATQQAKEMAAKKAPSMADVTGTGGGAKAPQWNGPASLSEILG